MLGWSVLLFALSAAGAYYGFAGVDTAFTGLAQVLFFLFAAMFALAVLIGLVTGGGEGRPALVGPLRTIALLAVVGVIAGGVHAWIVNDWSATRIGRAIDRRAAQAATADPGIAFERASRGASQLIAELEQTPSSADAQATAPQADPAGAQQ